MSRLISSPGTPAMLLFLFFFMPALHIGSVYSLPGFDPVQLRNNLQPLNLSGPPDTSEHLEKYLKFYGLEFEGASRYSGSFPYDTFMIAAHLFVTENAAGTVFMVHGYYDHTGILRNAIELCLSAGYSVASLDLPGHGISTGERAAIDDFSQYAGAIDGLLRHSRRHVPRPWIIIAHSIGGAAALEYMWKYDRRDVSKLILLAPGLRSAYHGLSVFGHAILSPFSFNAPRWFRRASHDSEFLEWFRNDPLQYDRFPVKWATALYAWQERLRSYDTLSVPVTVIQGTDDDVVDWRHNMKILSEKAPGVKIIPVTGARHQLLNESEPWRGEVLRAIRRELAGY